MALTNQQCCRRSESDGVVIGGPCASDVAKLELGITQRRKCRLVARVLDELGRGEVASLFETMEGDEHARLGIDGPRVVREGPNRRFEGRVGSKIGRHVAGLPSQRDLVETPLVRADEVQAVLLETRGPERDVGVDTDQVRRVAGRCAGARIEVRRCGSRQTGPRIRRRLLGGCSRVLAGSQKLRDRGEEDHRHEDEQGPHGERPGPREGGHQIRASGFRSRAGMAADPGPRAMGGT